MNVTVIGAGNSGLAMAAHLSSNGNKVTLWNRSISNIKKLIETHTIRCKGMIQGDIKIDSVTDDMKQAIEGSKVILITTPANSHKELAVQLAKNLEKETLIVLNPGRTFGAFEFQKIFNTINKDFKQTIAETQTIIYTCRKTDDDCVNIIAFKSNVLISALKSEENPYIIQRLPKCIQHYYIPAKSIIETSLGNIGMILHCAPLILNSGWTESKNNTYKYYCDGISTSIVGIIEKIDEERILVSQALGYKVESTIEWLKRTYHVKGSNIYECIQNNEVYKTIDAPNSLMHRYILEDVPCGLVPLESTGIELGIPMIYTSMTINLASSLLNTNFRKEGRFSYNEYIENDIGAQQDIAQKTVNESSIRINYFTRN